MNRKYSYRAHVERSRSGPGHVHHLKFILNDAQDPDVVCMLVVRTPVNGRLSVEEVAAYAQEQADAVRAALEDLEERHVWFGGQPAL